ncbi:beta family protein [Novosphingobium sp.]|uniref:beta family protein n=1 Tax=Novosphingobium sp. TaxID=1874826 RepID=UPI003D0D75D9
MLFFNRYYPTICVRRAEMRAMEKLPATEKEKMLPVTLLAPWLNSIEFNNTFNIVQKSIGSIPIIVDLDRYFEGSSPLPSRKYYSDLCNFDTGYILWEKLIHSHDNYIPCIQTFNVDKKAISHQIEYFLKLGRGLVFRFEIERNYDLDYLFERISEIMTDNLLCIFDYGYKEYSTELENRLSNLIDRLISISPTAKFVISGADFPNDFSQFDNFSEAKEISSRQIFEILRSKYGNYNLYYGDWASTKPRRYDGGGGTPLPRIDFPTKQRWIIARSKEDNWDFELAAKMITRLPEWDDRPHVWGTGMIEKTALGLPGGISTGPEAIACRVNIHLVVQNNYSIPSGSISPKGKWEDPI